MKIVLELPPRDDQDGVRLDQEYIRRRQEGSIPLIPRTDLPTGRRRIAPNPNRPLALCERMINLSLSEIIQRGGPELRQASSTGSFAAGNDEEALRNWANKEFIAYCLNQGSTGESLLEILRTSRKLSPRIIAAIATMLSNIPNFANLSEEQRLAAALIVSRTRPPIPPSA